MPRLRPFLVFAALLVAAIVPARAATGLTMAANVSTFTLDNGLQVVVIPDHRSPTVTHMVWYKAGSADEVPGKSGIAHFLEHLMFKGTSTHPEGEFSAKVNEIGGDENAFTTEDYTVYHQNIAKQYLGLMMSYEADRMENLILDDKAVTPERQVILEERRMRTDNDPGSQLAEAVGAALFQNSHYGIPVIGWAHEMAALTKDDAIAWYNRYYTPNNAIVIVAGDVTADEVRKLAEGTYGKVKRRAEPPPRIRPKEPPPLAARTVTFADARVTQPMLSRTYLVPSYGSADKGVAEAIDMLAEILGGGPTSRLYKQLVVDRGVATAAGTYYRGVALDVSRLALYGVPRGNVSLDQLGDAIDAVIADLIDKGVTADELAAAKRRMTAGALYAQDSHATLANVFGQALCTGQTVEEVQTWLDRIDAVTAEQVVAAAKLYLDPRRSVTGYLVGASGGPASPGVAAAGATPAPAPEAPAGQIQ
jgi:zinc protease